MKTPRLISVGHNFLQALFALCTAPALMAAAYTNIVAPNGLAALEGNSDDPTPFIDFINTVRYQEVFNSSQFSAVNQGGAFVTEMTLRANSPSSLHFAVTVSNIQINLSTTSKSADQLSTVFSQNIGQDETIVRGPSSLSLAGGGYPGAPQPFDFNIVFDRPFYYNPQAGNLLLDVRNYSGETVLISGSLDAQNTVGDAISRVYASSTIPNNGVNALSGTADSRGLIVDFVVMPVPEPSPLQLLLLGGLPLAFWLRLRKSMRRGSTHSLVRFLD